MAFLRLSVVSILGAALAIPAFAASTVHRAPTAGQSLHKKRVTHRHAVRKPRVRGQQAIEPDRVREIQSALIREHYMSGEPTGDWDAGTVAAMQKYQADQGWQTKLTPDSRALKKLGLGPDYSDAINAKNSTFATPPTDTTIPASQVAGFTAASGSAVAQPGTN